MTTATLTTTGATLNTTGTTLCKLWDDVCLPDNKLVRDLSAQFDPIVKAYCRGDTRLMANWVQAAAALSDASVKAGGKPLPKEFLLAPVSVAKGVTASGTPIPPPAVVVTVSDPSTGATGEKEVAVLVDGTQVPPNGNMTPPDAAPAPAKTSSGWGVPILIGVVAAVLVLK